jgi:hypothetical protein
VNVAQARIRFLHEQVRALEAEAVRPVRRPRLPRAVLLVVAAAIGAASAGVSHPSVRDEPVLVGAAVVHLIDPPAERARVLPAASHRRVPAERHHRTHVSVRLPRQAAVSAPVARPVAPAAAPQVTAPPAHHIARQRTLAPSPPVHARPAAPPAHARTQPQPPPAPVGVGVVVVTSSDEPAPVPAGPTPPTTP